MKIFCLKNEYIKEAEEYTISYLLNRCGFFFDWIDKSTKMDAYGLLLVYQPKNIQVKFNEPVIYLSKQFDLDSLTDFDGTWSETKIVNVAVPVLIHGNNQNLSKSNPTLSSFDLVANIYFHLARLEESGFTHPDDTDKNIQNNILYKHDKFLIPVVDILSDFFKQEVEKQFHKNNIFLIKKSYYPQGQSFGIALTHDIDFIRAFHPVKKRFIKLFIRLGLKKNIRIEDIDRLDDATWGFDQLLPFYKKNNIQATFFIMAKYMEGLHFRYRIGSSKIRQLFKHLKSDKHEIAFHPSRYAFENPDCYLKEKTKIEKISCTKISGLRHHYLRCLFPQIWRTASQLHLKYEAGMIHRRHSGFRAGTCFPFAAFDHKNQKCIDIIEFPITFFENTLPDKGNDFEASKDLIKKLMNVVKKHGGLLNILWHSNNLYQPEVYKKLWNFIINLIKTENAYIQPLIEHYSWHKLRENINIKSFKKSEKGYTIIIALPDGIQQFCLHVPANYKYKSNFKMQHDLIKNILIIDCNNTKTQLSIEALAK